MSETRRSVEASGKNVEDAVQKGLAQLGLRRDQVEIQVITPGSRGILGIGAEDARVRLIVLAPPAPPPPAVTAPPPAPPARPAPEPPPTPLARPVAEPAPVSPPELAAPPAPVTAPSPVAPPLPTAQPAPVPAQPAPAAAPVAIEDIAGQTVRDILSQMGLSANVTVRQSPAEAGDDGPAYQVDVRGGDLGGLIGRRGESLDALQYLTRLIVQHKTGEWASIIIDIDGYRERRAQALRSLASQMAERVKRDGRAISLEPMPPYERRIVHLALREHPAVMTVSVGEGDARKVTIRPKK